MKPPFSGVICKIKKMEYRAFSLITVGDLWLAGNEGMEKNMETIIMGYIGTYIRIHSFIPSYSPP